MRSEQTNSINFYFFQVEIIGLTFEVSIKKK